MPPSFASNDACSANESGKDTNKSGGEEDSAPESASPATPAHHPNNNHNSMNNAYNAFVASHPSLRRESAINLRAVAASMGTGFEQMQGMGMQVFSPPMNGAEMMSMGGMGMDAPPDLPSWALETYYGVGEPSPSSQQQAPSSSSMTEEGATAEHANAQECDRPTRDMDNAFRFPADFLPGPSASAEGTPDAPSPARSDVSQGSSGSSVASSSVGAGGMHGGHMPMNGFGGMMELDALPLHFPSSHSASNSPVPAPASTQSNSSSNDAQADHGMITFHNPFAAYGNGDEAHILGLDVPMSVGGMDDPLLGMGLQFSYEES